MEAERRNTRQPGRPPPAARRRLPPGTHVPPRHSRGLEVRSRCRYRPTPHETPTGWGPLSDDTRSRAEARVGFALALGAGILWGTSGPFNVGLFRNGVDPWSAAVLRPLVGTLLLLPILLVDRRRRVAAAGGRAGSRGWAGTGRASLVAAVVGGVPLALFQVAYARSTDALGVPATVALLYLSPALILALQGPLFGERPSRAQVGMAAISVSGVWMVVLGTGIGATAPRGPGVLWGLLTGATFGSYVLFGRWMSPAMGAVPTLTWSTAGAGGMLLLANGVLQRPLALPDSAFAWFLLVGLAAATLPAASLLFFAALSRIDPGRASVGATVEPLVGTLLAVLLLGQGVGTWGWLGMAVLIAGVSGTSLLTPSAGGSPPRLPPPPGS